MLSKSLIYKGFEWDFEGGKTMVLLFIDWFTRAEYNSHIDGNSGEIEEKERFIRTDFSET